ncbi:MAG: flagellar FlbD family protein [Phycisphaerae bacterium]
MISVTRLNGKPFVMNAELIKTIESTPDTMVTLISGEHLVVKESVEEVVRRAVAYCRSIRAFPA